MNIVLQIGVIKSWIRWLIKINEMLYPASPVFNKENLFNQCINGFKKYVKEWASVASYLNISILYSVNGE